MIYKCMYCSFFARHDTNYRSKGDWDYGMQQWFASARDQTENGTKVRKFTV